MTDPTADSPIRQERKDKAEQEWKDDPLKQYRKGRDVVITQERREDLAIDRFTKHLEESAEVSSGIGIRDVISDDIESFVDSVLDPDPDLSDTSVVDYLALLSKFYNVLVEENAIGSNPVRSVLEEEREKRDLEPPDRPYIPFENMVRFVGWLQTPRARAFHLNGLKHSTRIGECINIDLRCMNIAHPIFEEVIKEHDVTLDPRVRDKPDSIVIYAAFNQEDEIPNSDTPGVEESGEVRDTGNKRKEKNGSVLPVDSEFKTALVEWLLVRPPTYSLDIHPLFPGLTPAKEGTNQGNYQRWNHKNSRRALFRSSTIQDSLKNYGRQRALEECPDCQAPVTEHNPEHADRTGRRYECRSCGQTHWRSILWDHDLETPQKVTYHVFRHYFSDAHRANSSEIHQKTMVDAVRKHRLRGDKDSGDSDTEVYKKKQNQDWEIDIREPYLNAIYKFNLYDDEQLIPAVGEGWEQK
jgi:hypothetical protein